MCPPWRSRKERPDAVPKYLSRGLADRTGTGGGWCVPLSGVRGDVTVADPVETQPTPRPLIGSTKASPSGKGYLYPKGGLGHGTRKEDGTTGGRTYPGALSAWT